MEEEEEEDAGVARSSGGDGRPRDPTSLLGSKASEVEIEDLSEYLT